MDVIIHYPKSIRGWHTLARHAVAVSELIGLERQGKLTGPLEKRICQLTTDGIGIRSAFVGRSG